METFAFFKGACDAGKVPSVMTWAKTQRCVLGASDPSVIGESAVGIGTGIGIDELPCRLNADLRIKSIEGESIRVFDEVE